MKGYRPSSAVGSEGEREKRARIVTARWPPLPATKELADAHKIGLNGHGSARDLYGKKKELEANSPRSKTRADLEQRRRAARDGGRRRSADVDETR
jgi:hypothetical protein